MAISTVIAVVGTLAGASITGFLGYRTAKIREEGETARHRSDFYIEKKVETLFDLHAKLAEMDTIVGPYASEEIRSVIELSVQNKELDTDLSTEIVTSEDIVSAMEISGELTRLLAKSRIYFSEDEYEMLEEATKNMFGVSVLALESIQDEDERLDVYDINKDEYLKSYHSATELIQAELTDPIRALDNH